MWIALDDTRINVQYIEFFVLNQEIDRVHGGSFPMLLLQTVSGRTVSIPGGKALAVYEVLCALLEKKNEIWGPIIKSEREEE